MPKYLVEVDYSVEGTKGLIKEGGSKRRQAVEATLKSVGGKLECFYYTLGHRDCILIAEVPDNVTAVAISMAVGASGSVVYKTTPIVTPEEIDQAAKKAVAYRAPGGK